MNILRKLNKYLEDNFDKYIDGILIGLGFSGFLNDEQSYINSVLIIMCILLLIKYRNYLTKKHIKRFFKNFFKI